MAPRIDYPALDRMGRTRIIRGTPTEGATLDNEWGRAPLPEGFTEVRNEFGQPVRILVTGSAQTATSGEVRDRRPWAEAVVATSRSACEKKLREENRLGWGDLP